MSNAHGYKWIRPAKRHAIYARDGHRCLWCNRKVKPKSDFKLRSASLDHFLPRESGGTNCSRNLFTSCWYCNSIRQHMPAVMFAKEPAVLDRIIAQLDKPIDFKEGANACKRTTEGKRSRVGGSSARAVLVEKARAIRTGHAGRRAV